MRSAFLSLLMACGPATEPPGHDLELDPDLLDDLDTDDACDPYPGGSLAGDDLLVRVDKGPDRQLRLDWAPSDLVPIDPDLMVPGREGQLRLGAREALYRMLEAALDDGIELRVRSAYRSFHEQCVTYDAKLALHGPEHAARYSALPGRSQHQLGTTVDLTSADLAWELTPTIGVRPEGEWLSARAGEFGFALSYPRGQEDVTGYAWEPWHFRWVGRTAAAEMDAKELELAGYLVACEEAELECPRDKDPAVNQGFIGGSCASDDDCADVGTEALCLADRPGGSCSLPCERLCPDRRGYSTATFCAAEGLCLPRCDADLYPGDGCREGYACVQAERPDESGTAPVCRPE